MLRRFVVYSCFVMIFFLTLGYDPVFGGARGVTDGIVKVGLITDLTGPAASTLKDVTEGIRNYFRYVNDQGGVNDRKVKLIAEDDRHTIPMAISSFKKLVFRDEILSFIGPSSTGASKALLRLVEKRKVPSIHWSMAEALYTPTKRYVFVHWPKYKNQIKVIFDYIMKDLKAENPRIALVIPDNEMGKVGFKLAKLCAKLYNLELVDKEIIAPGALDATSQVLSLKRAKVDFVISHQIVNPHVALLRDARKFRLNVPFFGTISTCNEAAVRMAGESGKNFIGTHSFSAWYDNSPGVQNMREITLKYHPGTEEPMRSRYYTAGWVGAVIMTEAIKRGGKDLNNESLVTAMESIKELETNGLCGLITFASDKHSAGDYLKLFKADVKKGELNPISGWIKPAF